MEEIARYFWLGVSLGISISVIVTLMGILLSQWMNRPHSGGDEDSTTQRRRK